MPSVTILSTSKPRSTPSSLKKLLKSNTAATTHIVVAATSTPTRIDRRRAGPTALAAVADDDLSSSIAVALVDRQPVRIPIARPQVIVTAKVNRRPFMPRLTSPSRGTSTGEYT